MSALKALVHRPVFDMVREQIAVESAQDTFQDYRQTPTLTPVPIDEDVEPRVEITLVPEAKITVDIPTNKEDIDKFFEDLAEGQIKPEETPTEDQPTQTEPDESTWSNVSRQKEKRQETTTIRADNGRQVSIGPDQQPSPSPSPKTGGGLLGLLTLAALVLGCLLYTSPSPRDRTRSRMPSSA